MARRRKDETYYLAKTVLDYIGTVTLRDGEGPRAKVFINKYPLQEYHRSRIRSWRNSTAVSVGKLDEFLVRYGLSINEFEAWCEERALDPVAV